MHLTIVDDYPSTAAFGSDYFTRAARGDIRMEGPDGEIHRPEKVVITDRDLDYEGAICVGERTIRHLAHAFGMIDDWRVDRIKDDNEALRKELVLLSTEVAGLRSQLLMAQQMEARPVEKVYLALDGREHASARACMEADAKMLAVPTKIIAAAVPSPLLDPQGAEA